MIEPVEEEFTVEHSDANASDRLSEHTSPLESNQGQSQSGGIVAGEVEKAGTEVGGATVSDESDIGEVSGGLETSDASDNSENQLIGGSDDYPLPSDAISKMAPLEAPEIPALGDSEAKDEGEEGIGEEDISDDDSVSSKKPRDDSKIQQFDLTSDDESGAADGGDAADADADVAADADADVAADADEEKLGEVDF